MSKNVFKKGKKASLHSTPPTDISKNTTSKSISFYAENLEDMSQLKKLFGDFTRKAPNNSLVIRVAMRHLLKNLEAGNVDEDELERLILEMN